MDLGLGSGRAAGALAVLLASVVLVTTAPNLLGAWLWQATGWWWRVGLEGMLGLLALILAISSLASSTRRANRGAGWTIALPIGGAVLSTLALLLVAAVGALTFVAFSLFPLADPPRPTDAELRRAFERGRPTFDRLCREFPRLGVQALGRVPGHVMLATQDRTLFSAPSEEELAAAGLDRRSYDSTAEALARIDAQLVELDREGRVSFLMHTQGIVTSGLSTTIVCGGSPPSPIGGRESREGHGSACQDLESGWWLCDQWN